jgi:hypothetical protein
MNMTFLRFVLILLGMMLPALSAETNIVVFPFKDFTSEACPNRNVILEHSSAPFSDTNAFVPSDWKTYKTDASGVLSVTNLKTGCIG